MANRRKVTLTPEEVYSKLWRIADHILRENNPCQIRKAKNGRVTCVRTRKNPKWDPDGKLCCGGCKHLGPNGCTVESLGCKLGACYIGDPCWPEGAPNKEVVEDSLRLLKAAAAQHGVNLYIRQSKEEHFARLR